MQEANANLLSVQVAIEVYDVSLNSHLGLRAERGAVADVVTERRYSPSTIVSVTQTPLVGMTVFSGVKFAIAY